jgi:hypothetical protein
MNAGSNIAYYSSGMAGVISWFARKSSLDQSLLPIAFE